MDTHYQRNAPSTQYDFFAWDYDQADSVMLNSEIRSYGREELLRRSAFVESSGSDKSDLAVLAADGLQLVHSWSSSRQRYFGKGRHRTGYATHGLFPYRGKAHPQLMRALLNFVGIPYYSLIWDPMGGSGTTAIEANLIGINAVSFDVSPFCVFLTEVKSELLQADEEIVTSFRTISARCTETLKPGADAEEIRNALGFDRVVTLKNLDKQLFLLAWLDATGFAKRAKGLTFLKALRAVCKKYEKTLLRYYQYKAQRMPDLGKTLTICADARTSVLKPQTMDAVLTSPPYSFAIDYVAADWAILELLGYDPQRLYGSVIGLSGRTIADRISQYRRDMSEVGKQIVRVLRRSCPACVIVGSNDRQTRGINVVDIVAEELTAAGLDLQRSMIRSIKGINNSMKQETILVFRNGS